MTVPAKPLAEVTRRAIEVLTRELGAADTLRFVNQFTMGLGDYTAERDHLFGEETLDQILDAIKAKTSERPGASGPSKKTKNRRQRGRQSK
jgi:hypothetical protein